MAITLAAINQVVLRACFLPWYRQLLQDYGIPLAPDWNPSDEELTRLAEALGEAVAEWEED